MVVISVSISMYIKINKYIYIYIHMYIHILCKLCNVCTQVADTAGTTVFVP